MTRIKLYAVCCLLTCFALFSACDRQVDAPNSPLRTTGTDVITGIVIDQAQNPLEEVEVFNGEDLLALTNSEGVFEFDSGDITESDVLTFKHVDYVTVSRVYNENSDLLVFMKDREAAVSFESSEGQTIELESGFELDFPADAFELNGESYNGEVLVTVTYFDPLDQKDVISAPGPFISLDGDVLAPLSTYGMFEVLALTPEDEELDLAADVTATVNFPGIDGAPGDVNFYELNRETAYWAEVSVLENTGNQLQGEINTVNSSWNADEPCSDQLICVKVKIEWANGDPGCGIGATGVTYQGFYGWQRPDANDEVELMVCPDAVFELGACWYLCCGPGNPPSCCDNPQYKKNIDMSTVTLNPNGCTDLGTWVVPN